MLKSFKFLKPEKFVNKTHNPKVPNPGHTPAMMPARLLLDEPELDGPAAGVATTL